MEFLDIFCTAYLDNNQVEHEEHVSKVLQILCKAGLQVDIRKCEFHVQTTKFLGFIVGVEGIQVDPEKTTAI